MRKVKYVLFFITSMLVLWAFLIGVWLGKQAPCSDIEKIDIQKLPPAEDQT